LRSAAAGALGIIGDARAVEPLCAAMKDSDARVREAAAQALGSIGDARAVDVLLAALRDRAGDVRRAAVGALGRIDDPRAARAFAAAQPKGAETPLDAAASDVKAGAQGTGKAGASDAATASASDAAGSPGTAGSQDTHQADASQAAGSQGTESGAGADASIPITAPAAAVRPWAPTHLVPQTGMAAWTAPDPTKPHEWILEGRLDLVIDGTAGEWALVRAVNGWWGWVDRRLLVRIV
jgi:hypothetical protein